MLLFAPKCNMCLEQVFVLDSNMLEKEKFTVKFQSVTESNENTIPSVINKL
jgi:hypothetical protein